MNCSVREYIVDSIAVFFNIFTEMMFGIVLIAFYCKYSSKYNVVTHLVVTSDHAAFPKMNALHFIIQGIGHLISF